MEAKIKICDFCWNDDGKPKIAKFSYLNDEGNEYHACAKHAKEVKAAGLELSEISEHDFDYW